MLLIQDYLRQAGSSLDGLKTSHGVKSVLHPTLPLAILNYDQINSDKLDPLTRECRGLTLDTRDWSVVARSFHRFFNWGEATEEMPLFDWSNFVAQEKMDGSLIRLFNFEDRWHVNTRASFGDGIICDGGPTWTQGVCQALGVKRIADLGLDPSYTYVFEFCSPWNKIVRAYNRPLAKLLTIFEGERELSWPESLQVALEFHLNAVPSLKLYSLSEIQGWIQTKSEEDPTYEGVVVRDINNRRWKIKSPTYVALHRLKGEGDNLFMAKNLLPFVLRGERDELLTYFPEVADHYDRLAEYARKEYLNLLTVWDCYFDIEDQGEFARAILGRTPYTSILFRMRQDRFSDLYELWRDSERLILKNYQKLEYALS